MMTSQLLWMCVGVFAVAVLFSSVGQAGAAGFIAVMVLFSVPAPVVKPTALALTILVAGTGSFQFWRAGHFVWPLFWPLAAASVPAAFFGGCLNLPPRWFGLLLGVILLFSAAWFFVRPPPEEVLHPPARFHLLLTGAVVGLVSGLTGTGGGILLTPLVIFLRWASTKTAAAVASWFILVNAVAGLLGNVASTKHLPLLALPLALVALAGGTIGSYLGSRHFSSRAIKRLLAVVLTVAGLKLLLS